MRSSIKPASSVDASLDQQRGRAQSAPCTAALVSVSRPGGNDMATRTKSAPASKSASKSRATAPTKPTSTSGKTAVRAGKAAPKGKSRVWEYIKKNDLRDKAKRTI